MRLMRLAVPAPVALGTAFTPTAALSETGESVFTVAGETASPDTAASRPADTRVTSALGWILLLAAITIGLRRARGATL